MVAGDPFDEWRDALLPAGCPWPAPLPPRTRADSTPGAACPPEVTVYCAALEQPAGLAARLETLLSTDEVERADRLRGDALRRHFVVSHGVLRVILAAHVRTDPKALRFNTSGEAHGKPRLSNPPPGRAPDFNLSHSGGLALIGVTDRVEIGVDIEQIRPLDDLWSVADRVYTPTEIRALRGHAPDRQLAAWYRTWTRKEAALKAVGKGFGIDPRLLEMLAPDFVPTTVSDEFARASRGSAFHVTELQPAPGHAAALVVLDAAPRVHVARWPR